MNVPLIEMPVEEAKAAFHEYRRAVWAQHREDDVALMRGYKALAKGQQVLDLENVMRTAGLDEQGRPRLAICRADSLHCWFEHSRYISREGYRTVFASKERHARAGDRVVFAQDFFGRALTNRTFRAIVPSIPPRFRPKIALSNFHILWEAEWQTVPRDPILLRHLSGCLYAVLASWDLTELEMAVLKARATT
jgi:hypothetical protein